MIKLSKKAPQVTKMKQSLTTFKQGIVSNTDERCLPFKTAKMGYNFNFTSGALVQSLGFCKLKVKNANYPGQSDVEYYSIATPALFHPYKCWHYRHFDANNGYVKADKLLVIGNDRELLQYTIPTTTYGLPDNTSQFYLSGDPVDAVNYRLNGRDVMILTYEDAPMQVYDACESDANKLRTISTAPNILSMCVHYERLFAVVASNRNAVYFSSELDPTAWNISLTGAGFIEMIDERGRLTKVVSFAGYVYIFREYGIARLTAYADQSDFVVSQLFTSCGRIYENTIAVCGNKIIFLAEDGLYSFDGVSTKKLLMGIENMFDKKDNSKAVGAYFQGKYYLACNLNFFDSNKLGCENYTPVNNAVLQIDLKTGDLIVVRGIDISFMTSVTETRASQLVCCHNTFTNTFLGEITEGDGTYYGPKMKKSWLSPTTDFGYPTRKKIIREIHVFTKYDISIVITSDSETKTLNISAGTSKQKIKVEVKGFEFKFEIKADCQNAYISSPDIVFDVI